MTPTAKRLREQALDLPERDRLELAAELLASVGPEGEEISQEEWDRLWLAEADRRWAEIKEGRVETIPLDEVLRRARSRT
jgi:putative addiction module component (TIGR02574 family)